MANRLAAIVTGASRGIGRAIALELAQAGYDLMISHFDFAPAGGPDESAALETQHALMETGAACKILHSDISKASDRDKLVQLAEEAFGRCDMLVNNAGVAPDKRADLLEATEESFDRVMAINLKGPYFLTQKVANWMVRQVQAHPDRRCRIVNISSVSAYASSPARGEYCVWKAGVSMMTSLYADRLAEFGIGVFEIRPGIIATDMTAGREGEIRQDDRRRPDPHQTLGTPDDIARAVAAVARAAWTFPPGKSSTSTAAFTCGGCKEMT